MILFLQSEVNVWLIFALHEREIDNYFHRTIQLNGVFLLQMKGRQHKLVNSKHVFNTMYKHLTLTGKYYF